MKLLLMRLIAPVAALLVAAGCASGPEPPPAEAPWTPSELVFELSGRDPIEGFNRSMFAVTDFGMNYVVDPLGRVYTSILPRPAIEKFNNLCVNLEFPTRAFSTLLRAEFKGSWDELCRFLINTTIGIAGLFDPAAAWFDIYSTESDFGQTFAAWGIGPGCTLILPFMSTLNVRDGIASIFDMAFDIKTYIPYAGYATALNRMVVAHRVYEKTVRGSQDKYRTFHEMALLRRHLLQKMFFYHAQNAAAEARAAGVEPELPPDVPPPIKPKEYTALWRTIPGYRPQSPVLDSMRVAMFQPQNNDDPWYFRLSVFNGDFEKKCDKREIRLAGEEAPELEYGFWEAEPPGKESKGEEPLEKSPLLADLDGRRPDKLLILLPGIGGNYFGGTALALAELFHRNGWAVAALDSTFTWQFCEATGGRLPGFLPRDGQNVHRAIELVLNDLKEAELFDPASTRIALMGYSFGAMHTLKVAQLEARSGNRLGIDRFVAINPPVDLHYAMKQADKLAGTGSDWDAAKATETVLAIAGKAMGAMSQSYPPYDPENPGEKPVNYGVPISQEEADYIAALYFKMSMRGVLLSVHRDRGIPALSTPYSWSGRAALYREVDRFGFEDYAEKIIAPELAPLTLEDLYAASTLRDFAPDLERNPRIRVVHNYDDFLLSEDDREFLDRTFGSRLTWFDHGGHLGNLYVTTVQETLLEMAELPEPISEKGQK
ncbi:MlaA family lipoprotein [uncultured Victivallis sp.]|uniref:MlaA family lipoprotein n=1 Tax=uncultured Victivallis sp. TaxID=354118 RepID=UPI0025F5ACDE|nr:MlaA family lipoprotein [uncultured Victivallis sp.]